jgi:hypothetical protein
LVAGFNDKVLKWVYKPCFPVAWFGYRIIEFKYPPPHTGLLCHILFLPLPEMERKTMAVNKSMRHLYLSINKPHPQDFAVKTDYSKFAAPSYPGRLKPNYDKKDTICTNICLL